MLKVGLTGGIGSGKSTVGAIFALLGIPLFIADIRARALMISDESVKEKIRSLFGNSAFDIQGRPDRPFIASQVFYDQDLLNALNAIIHPAVRNDFEHWSLTYSTQPYVLHEAAILFESGGASLMDENIVVWAPEEIRINRVMMRDQVTENEVRLRMQYQWNDLERAAMSQFTVINDNAHSLIKQVRDIHLALCDIDANRTS